MHEYCDPMAGEHDIRAARKFAHIKAEAKALGVQMSANKQLRLGILPLGRCHHPGPDVA